MGPLYFEPGAPWQNGVGDSFHGRPRAECLKENWFTSIDDSRAKVEAWRRHYHEERPHSPWAT